MKKIIIYCLLCCLISMPALPQKYYETSIHWTDLQQANGILQKDDGNYLMGTSFKSFGDRWKIGLLETDTLGATQFLEDTTPDDSIGLYRDLTKVGNNYFMIGGVSLEETLPWKIIVTKFKEDYTYTNYLYGNGIRSQDAYACDSINSINMLVGGHIRNITANGRNPYLVKLNTATGEQLWDTMYYFQQQTFNTITSVATTSDGGAYLLATVNNNDINSDIALIQIDSMGVWQWDTIMNLTPPGWFSLDYSGRLIRTRDGGVVFSARRYSEEGAYGDIFKISADHTQVWHNAEFFLESGASGMLELSDSTLVFAGCSFATPTTTFIDGEICKLNKDGDRLWRRTYGQSTDDDYFYDLIVNNHDPSGKSGYVLCGRTESYAPAGKAYVYLVKTNCMGLLTEPQAAFTATMDSIALTASFQNLSEFVYPDSTDGGYFIWDFGDSTPPLQTQEVTPTQHLYAQEGIYIATLTAIVCNDTSTTYQSVCVGVSPHIAPNFTYVAQNDSLVSFTNTSSNAEGGTFIWQFGDGNTSTQANPTHTYAQGGNYTVTLTAVVCVDTSVFVQEVSTWAVGVSQIPHLQQVSSFTPNPTNNTTSLWYNLAEKETATISVFDLTGRKIGTNVLHDSGNYIFDATTCQTGIYIYTITINGTVIERNKLIVVK